MGSKESRHFTARSKQVEHRLLRVQPSALASTARDQDIAVIGMSCCLPGGLESPAMLWDTVLNGRCVVSKVPFGRWDLDAVAASKPHLSEHVKNCMMWGGFAQNLDLFDSSFFRVSSAEASTMDPQQRLLLLEHSWLAFLDAVQYLLQVQ